MKMKLWLVQVPSSSPHPSFFPQHFQYQQSKGRSQCVEQVQTQNQAGLSCFTPRLHKRTRPTEESEKGGRKRAQFYFCPEFIRLFVGRHSQENFGGTGCPSESLHILSHWYSRLLNTDPDCRTPCLSALRAVFIDWVFQYGP